MATPENKTTDIYCPGCPICKFCNATVTTGSDGEILFMTRKVTPVDGKPYTSDLKCDAITNRYINPYYYDN